MKCPPRIYYSEICGGAKKTTQREKWDYKPVRRIICHNNIITRLHAAPTELGVSLRKCELYKLISNITFPCLALFNFALKSIKFADHNIDCNGEKGERVA